MGYISLLISHCSCPSKDEQCSFIYCLPFTWTSLFSPGGYFRNKGANYIFTSGCEIHAETVSGPRQPQFNPCHIGVLCKGQRVPLFFLQAPYTPLICAPGIQYIIKCT